MGVNDQYRGLPLEEFTRNAAALLALAAEYRGGDPAGLVIVSIPDWGVTPHAARHDRQQVAEEIDRFNDAWRQLATGAGAPFIDVTTISRQHPLVADDGLHPSGRQYRLWVDVICPVVQGLLMPGRAGSVPA